MTEKRLQRYFVKESVIYSLRAIRSVCWIACFASVIKILIRQEVTLSCSYPGAQLGNFERGAHEYLKKEK